MQKGILQSQSRHVCAWPGGQNKNIDFCYPAGLFRHIVALFPKHCPRVPVSTPRPLIHVPEGCRLLVSALFPPYLSTPPACSLSLVATLFSVTFRREMFLAGSLVATLFPPSWKQAFCKKQRFVFFHFFLCLVVVSDACFI